MLNDEVPARATAVILRGDRLLVIRRHKHGQDYYVLPGGGIEPGETAEQACVREAREETSLIVSVRKLLKAFDNQGRQEYYFLVDAQPGIPQLSGPESARQSASNQYEIQWIGYGQLDKINLMPVDMQVVCRSLLRSAIRRRPLRHYLTRRKPPLTPG